MGTSETRREWNPYCSFIVFLLLFLMPSLSLGWTSRKCNIAGESMPLRDLIFAKSCGLSKNTTLLALCSNITDVEADLSDVPTTIQILCLSGSNSVIQGGNFAKFRKLIYLTMKMPVHNVLPEAFKGLENLESLSISFLGTTTCNNLSLAEDVFVTLHSLKFLNIQGFHLTQGRLIRLPPSINLRMLSLPQNCICDLFQVFSMFPDILSVHTLDVGMNKIQTVDDTILQNKSITKLPNITVLNLSENPLKRVNPDAFARFQLRLLNLDFTFLTLSDLLSSGIVKLESLSLTSAFRRGVNMTNLLCSIAARLQLKSFYLQGIRTSVIHDLSGCSLVEHLILNHNQLNSVNCSILYVMPKLKILNLSYNFLSLDLCPTWYDNNFTSGLRDLHFSNNHVRVLKKRQFFCMTQLRGLHLENNEIQTIETSAFWGLKELQMLDLTSNRLTELQSDSFSGLSKLMCFCVKNNGLKYLKSNIAKELIQLQNLKIGSLSEYISVVLLPGLQQLDIQSGKHIGIHVNMTISSLYRLVANGSRINIDAKCNHTLFTNLRELKIYNNNEIESCGASGFPLQHFKYLERLLYQHNGKSFTEKLNFSNIPSLISLEVENLATALNNPNINPQDIFQKLYKLEILTLVNSGLKYVTAALFKDMSSLRLLVMKNGMMLAIEPSIQSALAHVNYVYFYDMTFQCDCVNSRFVSWALKQNKTFVSAIGTAICLQLNKVHNLLVFVEKSCNQNIELILFLLTFPSLSLFITLTLLYNIFNSNILHLFFIFQAWLQKHRGKRGGSIKYDYDAFVSYCSLDQDWVMQYLIPNLEEKGPPFVKLCLHNRDFQVGKDIVENIMDSIYKSRKTICLISHNYLRSEWCSLEMRMATYRILAEKNDDLILIFLEHISRYQLSSYHRVAKMVKRKTYIDWPEGNNKQIAFWERLRRAIRETQIPMEIP